MPAFRYQFIPFVEQITIDIFCDVQLLNSTKGTLSSYRVVRWCMADYSPLDVVVTTLVLYPPDFFSDPTVRVRPIVEGEFVVVPTLFPGTFAHTYILFRAVIW